MIGINELKELSGKPGSSFFVIGNTTVYISIALGAVITLFTGKTVLYSGFRIVIFGLLAAAVAFGIGRWIG